MHSLFIDSTSGLSVGLLNDKFDWVEFQVLDHKKPSEIVHQQIYFLLEAHKLNSQSIRCFCTAGPGSYTGMRLSEGIAQIFELCGVSVYSFYHFEIPQLIGIEKGYWASNAFKGEIFIYNWNSSENEKLLVKKDNVNFIDKTEGFTLNNEDEFFSGLQSSKNLIKTKSQQLFSKVIEKNTRVKPYYFRTLEEEFR